MGCTALQRAVAGSLPSLLVLAYAAAGPTVARAADAKLDFNRDIRPILSDRCFSCHGPENEDRQAGLRLDLRDAAITPLDSGLTAVVPGDPAKSEIIARMTSTDPDVVMPPPRLNKPITPAEADILKRWITEGAEYRGHWAFERVERPAVPEVKNTAWPKTPIDRFILTRLGAGGTRADSSGYQTDSSRQNLCTGCGQGFVIAFSCKGRGVCPSCNGRHMAQTAAHLVDHVILPVPVRQWVISVPKRLRCFLANRPEAVAALTKIFLAEIERLLSTAVGVTIDAAAPAAARPRLGAVSFLHRFGSALNHHVHLHMCATDGVFMPAAGGTGCCAPPTFLPARPITQADLATVTERVRRRVIRWFRLAHLLDASAAADMLKWGNSGFSIDASVRIALIDRDVPSYFRSLEHLLRYCARPPFALERLSVTHDTSGRIAGVRHVLPRHKAATWVGPGRGRKSTRPGANGVVEVSPFEFLDRLADLVTPPRKHRHRYHCVFAPNHPLRPAVTSLAIGNVGKRKEAVAGGHASDGHGTAGFCNATHEHQKPRSHDTSRIAWAKLMARVGEEFPLECPNCGGDIRLRGDGRQEPAHFEPEVRKRKKARMAAPA